MKCYRDNIDSVKEIFGNIISNEENIRKLCNDILKTDSKIRFVGIFYHNEFTHVSREGLTRLLNKVESEKSVRMSSISWSTGKTLSNKLGEPEFGLVKYGEIYRITIPLTDKDLIMISTDTDCDIINLMQKIQKVKYNLKNT